jgi:hypothetical protein
MSRNAKLMIGTAIILATLGSATGVLAAQTGAQAQTIIQDATPTSAPSGLRTFLSNGADAAKRNLVGASGGSLFGRQPNARAAERRAEDAPGERPVAKAETRAAIAATSAPKSAPSVSVQPLTSPSLAVASFPPREIANANPVTAKPTASAVADNAQGDFNAPQIQLITPTAIAMRGVTTVRVGSELKEVALIAQVSSKTRLTQVLVNDRVVVPDAAGMITTRVAMNGKTTPVEIAAMDAFGRRATLPLVLATGDLVREPGRAAIPKRGFGNYYALVIGNASYQHWESLGTPHADALAVSQVLDRKYGFNVTTVLDASRGRIFREIAKLRATLTENDNLLIYYSGHGQWDNANQKGYWVPVDGEKDNVANYISSADITDQLIALRARQVLVVADACYAGVLVRNVAEQNAASAANKTNWLLSRAQLQSRKVMSSGGVRQVMDGGGGRHSIFARQFLEGLNRMSEPFEAGELYREIAPRVESVAKGFGEQQQPQYGQLRSSGHVGGDFVFVPRSESRVAAL